ncbi:MAG: TRAP transporter substrate-binding protein DctP [Fidelibacterota bacterium]
MTCFSKVFWLRKSAVLSLLVLFPLILEARVVIKLATLAPEGSPWHEILLELSQRWKKATKGEVIVKIYAGGVAGEERDVVRKMRIGQLQAAAVTVEGLTEISQDMNVFYIPMLAQSSEELAFIREKLAPDLHNDLNRKGFKLLAWADVGWAYWFTNEKITTPFQMQQLKLFTWAGDYRFVDLYKKLGFHPVPMSTADMLTSLQTKMIDGFATTPMFALSFQWFALAPHMLKMKWGPIIGGVVITNEAWNNIPVKYHPELEAITTDIEKKAGEIVALAEKAMEVMKENNLTVHDPTESDLEEWRKLMLSVYPYVRGSIVPEKIFDKAIALQRQFHQEK